jgi:hypothetical protein
VERLCLRLLRLEGVLLRSSPITAGRGFPPSATLPTGAVETLRAASSFSLLVLPLRLHHIFGGRAQARNCRVIARRSGMCLGAGYYLWREQRQIMARGGGRSTTGAQLYVVRGHVWHGCQSRGGGRRRAMREMSRMRLRVENGARPGTGEGVRAFVGWPQAWAACDAAGKGSSKQGELAGCTGRRISLGQSAGGDRRAPRRQLDWTGTGRAPLDAPHPEIGRMRTDEARGIVSACAVQRSRSPQATRRGRPPTAARCEHARSTTQRPPATQKKQPWSKAKLPRSASTLPAI